MEIGPDSDRLKSTKHRMVFVVEPLPTRARMSASKSDLPAFHRYFVPTVECFKARGGSMTIEEMEEAVAEAMAALR